MSYLTYSGKRVISGGKFAILAANAPPPSSDILFTSNLSNLSFYADGIGSIDVDWGDGFIGTYVLNENWPVISHAGAVGTIKISNASIITDILLDDLEMTSLTIPSTCVNLSELSINRNLLTTLELPYLPTLWKIYADDNSLTTFNLSNDPLLAYLWMGNNLLTSISLSNLNSLNYVFLNDNQLTSFTVNTNWPLKQLDLRNNLISSDLIDNILIDCVATSIAGFNTHIYLNGISMAVPTATGLAAKATLEGRGVSVSISGDN